MDPKHLEHARLVPVDAITVLNPRERNPKIFEEITSNIKAIGLKRPITVAERNDPADGGTHYELVCGQGRLEAFKALGQSEIPAIVISASREDCLVMSLVENIARRQHHSLDLLRDVKRLKENGYSIPDIASKTQLSKKYVSGVIKLLEEGEHRLLRATESGKIPISIAVEIAEADDVGVQAVLRKAYEDGHLRGARLIAARRLVEARRVHGKGRGRSPRPKSQTMSVEALLRTYQNDVERKRNLIRKADAIQNEISFLSQSFKTLLADANFVNLLRAEGLTDVPQVIADKIARAGGAHI
jgi:ParB family chromosome partitioning protein